jgi:hypothetical protein
MRAPRDADQQPREAVPLGGLDGEKGSLATRSRFGMLLSLVGRAVSKANYDPLPVKITDATARPAIRGSAGRYNGAAPRQQTQPQRKEAPTSWQETLRQRREEAESEFRAQQEKERARERERWRKALSGEMSVAQALEVLGLEAGADEPRIQAAYQALIMSEWPDVRNSEFLTKLAGAARSALLGGGARSKA